MAILYYDDSIIINDEILTEEKMCIIADYLSNSKRIRKLIFNNVVFKENAVQKFCQNVDFNYREGERVMFEFNHSTLSVQDILSLSNYFQYFTKLHFKNCSLTNDAIKIIADYISKNPNNITTLHLEGNRFGTNGHHALITALSTNSHIDKVFLKNTHDFRNGEDYTPIYQQIASLLQMTTIIKVIGLQESKVNFSYLSILAEGLSKNRSLHKIDLGNNVFEEDKTGELTQKIGDAIFNQGMINQFDNRVKAGSKNRHLAKIRSIVKEHQRDRDQFFSAIGRCDLEAINAAISNGKVNLQWTTNDNNYNALHILALSRSPISIIKQVIESLYKNNFKTLLHKRCGRPGGSHQAMELAVMAGRKDIAVALDSTWAAQVRVVEKAVSSKPAVKILAPSYKNCGFFTKSLNDTAEFPSLCTTVKSLKG
jgi:hypothetical protein